MAIPWGFLLLTPALAAAGGSGLPWQRADVAGWSPNIAANGILVLIPSALYLASKVRAGEFDTAFYAAQVLELAAGAANITLFRLNMRDGLRMKGRFRRQPA